MQKSLMLATITAALLAGAAYAQTPAALTAKKDGSTIAVSVATDNRGRYSFPVSRLEPGHYSLKIRAVGYELDQARAADVKPGGTATADLKLVPAKNLGAQLTNAELLMSAPGTEQQKKFLLSCN